MDPSLTTEAGRLLLTQGLLGAAVLALIGVVVFLYRELRKSEDRRFEELVKMTDARESVAKALAANTLALESHTRTMEQRTRATEELVRLIAEMKHEIESAFQAHGFADQLAKAKLEEIVGRLDAVLAQVQTLHGLLQGKGGA